MQVGLLSDVHANVVALRAVLEDAPSVDEWLHAGDVVGYGPWPAETIAALREQEVASIQGNHDRAALGDFHEGFEGLPRELIEWTTARLDDDDLAYLASLPVERECYDGRVRLVHGAPGAPDRYTYSEDADASLLGDEDVLVLGHTHEQFLREFGPGTVVNPGSVGQPRDGDWRAAYAVFDLATGAVELRRVAYERERIQGALRDLGFPERLIEAYETGHIVPAERAERPD